MTAAAVSSDVEVVEWRELLIKALAGRTAVFVREHNHPAYTMSWDPQTLPHVFVSPDIFSDLAKKDGSVVDWSGNVPRLTLSYTV